MFTTCFINQRGFVLLKGKISYDKLNRLYLPLRNLKLNDESKFFIFSFFFFLTSRNYTMKNDPSELITTENTSI